MYWQSKIALKKAKRGRKLSKTKEDVAKVLYVRYFIKMASEMHIIYISKWCTMVYALNVPAELVQIAVTIKFVHV